MGHAEQRVNTEFTEGHVEAAGFRIRYLEAGHGSSVVMFHGMGGLILTKLHDELAKKYHVVAFEMPGFGNSPINITSQSVQDVAQTMAQAMAQRGLDSYALIGTSFGSRIALWQTLQSPQQVDLLVLIAPTAVLPEGYSLPVVASEQSTSLLYAHPEHLSALPVPDPAQAAKEMTLVRRLQGISRDRDLEDRLSHIQTPTLVVFGTADRIVPPAMGRTYRERMPNCHFVMVYDAGHAVASERPEALANTVTDFLDLRETFIVSRRDGRINP
jgi:pimeloyl-ACP methyl ester carboxylesterase